MNESVVWIFHKEIFFCLSCLRGMTWYLTYVDYNDKRETWSCFRGMTWCFDCWFMLIIISWETYTQFLVAMSLWSIFFLWRNCTAFTICMARYTSCCVDNDCKTKQTRESNKSNSAFGQKEKKKLWGGGWGWGLSPKISEYNQVGRYFILKLHCSFA